MPFAGWALDRALSRRSPAMDCEEISQSGMSNCIYASCAHILHGIPIAPILIRFALILQH